MNNSSASYADRVAVLISRIFHPYLICIPTLFWVTDDLPFQEAAGWSALILAFVLLPGMSLAFYIQKRGSDLRDRKTRNPLYLVGWCSILVCLIVLGLFHAPTVLIACLVALAVWAPMQYLVNARLTKISTHAGVASGCFASLVMLGKIQNPLVLLFLLVCVVLVFWARLRTKNHTLVQIVLGLIVGVIPALIVFPLFVR